MASYRTQFFFIKNSVVLNALAKSKVNKLCLDNSLLQQPCKKANFFGFFGPTRTSPVQRKNLRTTRPYSQWTIPSTVPRLSSQFKNNTLNTIKRSYSSSTIVPKSNETVKNEDPEEMDTAAHKQSSLSFTSPVLHSSRSVGIWLITISSLTFAIVVIGGLTRLTESGLSITEWKPITGSLPPLSQEQWEAEFKKYQESPEFKLLNSHITLDEFKFIFFMEWIHRLWGRSIGLLFVFPAVYFIKKNRIASYDVPKVFLLTLLLGLQGAVGWWMVKSGLDQEQLDDRKSKPTVSQYRLTTHLGLAFTFYLCSLSMGFRILKEARWFKNPSETLKLIEMLDNPKLHQMRKYSRLLLGLTFVTAMSGGLVAGLDAGLIYNTFPHMGDNYLPSKNELFDPTFSRKESRSDLIWRNILENPTTVQLTHRIFATTTFFAVLAYHMYAIKMKPFVPRRSLKLINAAMGVVTCQVALGISTLIYLVPIPLAAAHQAGALVLLTSVLAIFSSLKQPGFFVRRIIYGLRKVKPTKGVEKPLQALIK